MIVEGAVAATLYMASKKTNEVSVPSISQATIEKFKSWEKEDWFKDDPYRDMWEKDWIKKK